MDCFKGAFQFGKLAAAAPPGDVPKGIVRRIKPVVLADGISDAFRFDFAGTPVNTGLLFVLRRVQIYIVQLCVCDFMYRRFQGLNLAHALVNGNALVLQMVVAMRATRYLLKANRNGEVFSRAAKKSL